MAATYSLGMSRHVVVIGGSIAGLGCGLALVSAGCDVTVVEADATPLPDSLEEAWWSWDRRGAPQSRHTHILLARLRNLVRDHAPDFLAELHANGVLEYHFDDFARRQYGADVALEPGDDDLVMLACRRVTFEYLLRRHTLATGRISFRQGRVVGLRARGGTVAHVEGVHLDDGTGIAADLVVDASGRRSAVATWLTDLGASAPPEEETACGIFYTSRFYRLRDGAAYPTGGPYERGLEGVATFDLPYLKGMVGRGDNRTFSVTMAGDPDDQVMRRLLTEEGYQAAVGQIPLFEPWLHPDVAEPISPVHGMAAIRDLRRWFVVDGTPLVTGFVPVGDSLMHTNPIVGLGCSLAWMGAFALREVVAALDDPLALVLAYHDRIEADVVPWYDEQVKMDRATLHRNASIRADGDADYWSDPDERGTPPTPLEIFRLGLPHAMEADVGVARRMMRRMNLLDSPRALADDPLVQQKVFDGYLRRHESTRPAPGPPRAQFVAALS
jgi:2-polyprenyl-6-methoxyphenol hydroxylase-like FAD-dependent oxidoreductase